MWSRSELTGFAIFSYLFIFLLAQKNERRVVYATPLQKSARGINSVIYHAAGPSDFVALLKNAGNFQTRGVYPPQGGTEMSARKGAQTVKIPLSAFFPVLTKCQWEKILNTALQGPINAGSFGPGSLLRTTLLF